MDQSSVQAVQLFAPYGSVRYSDQVMPTDYNFTGQRLDSQTGLLYYNARYYDPVSGRFISSDTVQNNTKGMDSYAYVGDNPVVRTDPSGKCWPLCTMLIGAAIGAVVSVAATVAVGAIQGKMPSGGEIAQAAVTGAVAGAITGLAGPEAAPLARVAIGAIASGAGQAVGNAMQGKPIMDGVGAATVEGALTGGLVEGAGALAGRIGSDVEEGAASVLNDTENGAVPLSSNLVGKMDRLKQYASQIQEQTGVYDVVAHGDPEGVAIQGNDGQWTTLSANKLANYMRKTGYQGGPVRLIACNTGCGDWSPAQDLANVLGEDVTAPTDTVYIRSDGSLSTGPNEYVDTNAWQTFSPVPIYRPLGAIRAE